MNTNPSDEVQQAIKARLAELPQVVQDAIASADVEKRMRALAESYKLHLDQWNKLENEVTLTLLGFLPASELPKNIQNEVGVSEEIAAQLAVSVNEIVFEPIRQELERQLESPEAKEKELTGAEAARAQILGQSASSDEAHPAADSSVRSNLTVNPVPSTPAAAPPTEKAVRAPLSSAYTARQPSTERKIIEGDPYRELPK